MLVIVLEEAEVGIHTSQIVREIGKLSDLKELLLLHNPFLHPLLYYIT